MKLEQLRYLCALIDEDMNMTRAAAKLNASQPGVSKQIKLLEQELDLKILIRGSQRIVGLTPVGSHIAEVARRMLTDAQLIKSYSLNAVNLRRKRLTVATTHLYANYVFPTFITDFHLSHPDVELVLRNGDPKDIIEDVISGRADIGLAASVPNDHKHLLRIPGFQFGRTLIVPKGHPLTQIRKITLEECAKYPLVTYCENFVGSRVVTNAFERQALQPTIAIRTIDTESIKKYVKLGLGIAVIQSVTVEPGSDPQLVDFDVTDLFGTTTSSILIRPSTRFQKHYWDFIEKLEPGWDSEKIKQAKQALQKKATGAYA